MNILWRIAALLILVLWFPGVNAVEDDATRILVTFADPGMSNAARPGPARPGYTLRSSTYLVSVTVRRAANRVAKDFDLEVVDEWPIVPLKVHCLVYEVADGTTLDSLLAELRERPEVESAQRLNEFDVRSTVDGAVDPLAKLQHNLHTIELVQAHAWSRGKGASITVIDTGADVHHPDLKSQIHEHHDFTARDSGEFSADAHGTAVVGVIAAASDNGIGMRGIAPEAQLHVLRACRYLSDRSRARCNSFALAKALTHALESKTQIINLSLGGPPDELLGRLLRLALQRGVVVIAAAPATAEAGFPIDVPGVISVASLKAGNSTALAWQFVAPGDEILVPVPGGGFDYASGTSLSAAHVSGVVALLLSQAPDIDRDDVARLLTESRMADDMSVNACRVLAQALQQTGCRRVAAAESASVRESESER